MTHKQKALDLLAKNTLDDGDLADLSVLTAEYVGYAVKPTRVVEGRGGPIQVYALFKDGVWIEGDTVDINSLWDAAPQYAVSIDACWSLPLDKMGWILAWDGETPDGYNAELWCDCCANRVVYRTATSLPLAMLKAWWSIQGKGKSEPLMLDDYGMLLLDQLHEAYGDWQAVYEHGERTPLEVSGDNGIATTLQLPPMDMHERARALETLTRDFVSHVMLLDQNRDMTTTRTFDKHLTLDPSMLMIIYRAREIQQIWTLEHVVQQIIPLYRTFKARQDRKTAWLKAHPR